MSERRYKIIYEDEAVVVVEKPSGMLVIPSPKGEMNTLADLLNKDLHSRGVEANAHPCHRIDRETSGLVVFAKGKKFQGLLMEEFKKRSVKKSYIAFVHGKLKKNFDTISLSIYNRNKDRVQDAVTRYRVTRRFPGFTIVEVEPVTGRTNQIRIHFAGIGHPLVGESLFCFRKDFDLKFKRTALHAHTIEFKHPVSGKMMKFESPMPDDMLKLMGQ
ncbi:MAG: RluA family pseudouridine synthase [Candidatus Omnitrophica bacterium]|nr:RluA family pseudouridine synthase [Candidatus Omnitrophota bacterium]